MEIYYFGFIRILAGSSESVRHVEDLANTRLLAEKSVQTLWVLRIKVARQLASDTEYSGCPAESHVFIGNLAR